MKRYCENIDAGVRIGVSVVVPTFNGAERLRGLLDSLRHQQIEHLDVEIVVVDDDSTDATRDVAKAYGCKVVTNGHKSPERGKAIGLKNASHELVLFIDDDNRLPHRSWLQRAVAVLNEWPDAVGVQSCRFAYRPSDSLVNRWASIFGVGDPLAFYMGRRDHFTRAEYDWSLGGRVIDRMDDAWLVAFAPDEFPTLGSQGYLTRKSLQLPLIKNDYWLHIDANFELAANGRDRFAFLDYEVVHEYCEDVSHLLSKLRRNIRFFLTQRGARSYRWDSSPMAVAKAAITMTSLVAPMRRALREFRRTPDIACFLHVYLCLIVPLLYGLEVLRSKLKQYRRITSD